MKALSTALVIAAVALVGCTSVPPPAVGSARPTEPGNAFAPPGDGQFLASLQDVPTGLSDVEAVALGRKVCTLFQQGRTGQDASAAIVERRLTIDQSVVLIRAAVAAYCPAYTDATLN